MVERIGRNSAVLCSENDGNIENKPSAASRWSRELSSSPVADIRLAGLANRAGGTQENFQTTTSERGPLFDNGLMQEVAESWMPPARVIEALMPMDRLDGNVAWASIESWVPGDDVISDTSLACRLIARARRGDPTMLKVEMGETQSVDVALGQAKTILTLGLHRNRSSALVIISKHADGKRSCTFSHHPTPSADQQMALVREVLSRYVTGDDGAEHKVFIITPEKQEGHPDGHPKSDAIGQVSVEIRTNTRQKKLLNVQPTLLRYVADKNIQLPRECILHIPSQDDLPIILCGDRSRSAVI